jgi:imidazolonepropionase-like amidohydrolase
MRSTSMKRIAVAAVAAAWLFGAAGQPARAEDEPVLLRNGTVLTMAGPAIEGGSVLLRDGRIVAVGAGTLEAPAGTRVIDCSGRFILPGFIDAGTRLGLVEIDMVKSTNDTDEGTEPSTPDLDVRDGVNQDSDLWAVARSRGVVVALVVPQEANVFGGRAAVLRCLDGPEGPMDARTVKAPAALFISLGVPPRERFGEKDRSPSTRMGIAAVLRREFQKAKEYAATRDRHAAKTEAAAGKGEDPPDPPAVDAGLEVLASALAGTIPVIARAERLDDIATALRIADEFGLRLILYRATEAWKLAEELAARRIPVILGPVTRQPDSPEVPGARMDAAAILHRAGVRLCLMTGDAHNVRNLPFHAGIAMSYGLPKEAALSLITREAAVILGVDADLGTIEVGKEGTLLVVQGDPLEPLSKMEHVFIRGREVSLRSRQTQLHERWRDR